MKLSSVVISALVMFGLAASSASYAYDEGRTEASQDYLESRYGADKRKWPCDTKPGPQGQVRQLNVGDAPANHPSNRASKYTRDRK